MWDAYLIQFMCVCVNLTVSKALLTTSATGIVRSSGLFWLKPVTMLLFIAPNDTDYKRCSCHGGFKL